MSRLVESDECERCGDRVDVLCRLCPDCTRIHCERKYHAQGKEDKEKIPEGDANQGKFGG